MYFKFKLCGMTIPFTIDNYGIYYCIMIFILNCVYHTFVYNKNIVYKEKKYILSCKFYNFIYVITKINSCFRR
jgi:hypothetical protein